MAIRLNAKQNFTRTCQILKSLGDLLKVVAHMAVNDKLSEVCENQLHVLMQSQTHKTPLRVTHFAQRSPNFSSISIYTQFGPLYPKMQKKIDENTIDPG